MTSQPLNQKAFDCVQMMHQGAARLRKELADRSSDELKAYWHEKTRILLERQAKLREHESRIQERQ